MRLPDKFLSRNSVSAFRSSRIPKPTASPTAHQATHHQKILTQKQRHRPHSRRNGHAVYGVNTNVHQHQTSQVLPSTETLGDNNASSLLRQPGTLRLSQHMRQLSHCVRTTRPQLQSSIRPSRLPLRMSRRRNRLKRPCRPLLRHPPTAINRLARQPCQAMSVNRQISAAQAISRTQRPARLQTLMKS